MLRLKSSFIRFLNDLNQRDRIFLLHNKISKGIILILKDSQPNEMMIINYKIINKDIIKKTIYI